jgi:hypothetical protein
MTKKNFSDMILYKLAGGVPDANFPIDERDIWDALEHSVNETFKMQQFDTNLPSGETIPENTMIATYTGNAVTSLNNGKSFATLPVIPITLPKGVGIYMIYDPNNPDVPFIPLQRGQLSLLKVDTLLNDLMGQVGYEAKSSTVLFTKDITTFGITDVTMELCVFDMSGYGINDEMPIPADYIGKLEDELIAQFARVLPESGLVNNFTNLGQTVPGNASNDKK